MADTNDIDLWNAAAAHYEESAHRGTFQWRQAHIISPALLGLLDEVKGQDVLDAGCGPGWLSLELTRRGARVIGLDGAEQMLARARRQALEASQIVRFVQADLCSPLPLPDGAFDAVVSNMVLMDIPVLETALAEFRRLLRPAGRLVFSITHPAFFLWFWARDDAGKRLHKPVDDYLTCRPDMNDFWGPTRHYHRPLSWYVEALAGAGFAVEALVEPVPEGRARDADTDHLWRLPDYVVIRALPRPGDWPAHTRRAANGLPAPCGLMCAECEAYRATQANDAARIAEVAAEWSLRYDLIFTPDDVWCDGCTSTSTRTSRHCGECPVRPCAPARGFVTCAECGDYPCERLAAIHRLAPAARERLEAMRRGGGVGGTGT